MKNQMYPFHHEHILTYPDKAHGLTNEELLAEIRGRTPVQLERAAREDYRAYRRALIREAVVRGLMKDPLDAPKEAQK